MKSLKTYLFALFLMLLNLSVSAQYWEKTLPVGAGFKSENSKHQYINVISQHPGAMLPTKFTICKVSMYGDSIRSFTAVDSNFIINTNGIQELIDSSYIILGTNYGYAYLARVDYNGNFIWKDTITYRGASSYVDVSMLNDSQFIVVGTTGTWSNGIKGLLAKYNIQGSRIWAKEVGQAKLRIKDWTDSTKVIESGWNACIFEELDSDGNLNPIFTVQGWPTNAGDGNHGDFINNNGTLIIRGEHYFSLRSASADVRKSSSGVATFDINWDTNPSTESYFSHLDNSYAKNAYILTGNLYGFNGAASGGYGPFMNGFFVKMDTTGTIDYQRNYPGPLYWCKEDSAGCYLIHMANKLVYNCCGSGILVLASPTTLWLCSGDSALIFGKYRNTIGDYFDTLQTVHGCDSIILTTKLLLYPLPFVSLTALNPDTLCNTASTFTLNNGYPLGGVYSGAGINSNSFDPATAGVGNHAIVYTVTDFHGCSNSDTATVRVENCLGEPVLKPSNDFGISYYPNPINTKLVLEKQVGFSTPVRVKLVDAASRSILEKNIPIEVQKTELDVSALSSGVYYLQFIFENKTITKVIQKN